MWRAKELWQGRKKFCINGHRFTKKSTQVTVYFNGDVIRRCRVCQSEKDKKRYRCDPVRRAAVIARQKAQYERRKLTAAVTPPEECVYYGC